jgi:hypothetical protein
MRVTFLTVGEYPTATGLHASQVLPFAAYLHNQRVRVNWIAFVPFEMRLRDLLVNGGSQLEDMRKLATKHGIEFTVCIFPLTIVRVYSYVFRRWLIPLAGSKLSKLLKGSHSSNELHIIHCRSYFAAAAALRAKREYRQLQVSFDMRSLLPPEVPLMFPLLGKYLYGGLKEWEFFLLKEVDFSFLPCIRGIRLLELEGAGSLPMHIPIAGFDDSPTSEKCENLLDRAVIGYVGGLGAWQSSSMLEKLFAGLAGYLPNCTFEVLTTDTFACNPPVKVYSLPHHEVKDTIKRMLALAVPGPDVVDGYFTGSKLSANFFSTKAAEALSLGVPLLVNVKIRELADYVRENRCGLVFSLENGCLSFEGVDNGQLKNNRFWADLHRAAHDCALEFRRQAVYARYLAEWNKSI